jgi:toxin ParE1/3/4
MAKSHFSNKAVEDLDDIWQYSLETWSESQADTYYYDLVAACQDIAEHPTYLDREYNEILPGLYGHRCHKHLIFYYLVEDGVEIARILHERMDIPAKFDA